MNYLEKMSDRTIKILLYIAFAVVTVVSSMQLLVPGVIDEIGTLSNTAFLAGNDWIKCIQSMGGFYYKYGQVIFYYPFYMLLRDYPFLIYPVLVSVQMVFISLIPVIAYHIARTYFQIESKLSALLIALGGGGISSIWLYAEYTRGEFMLILLPWVLALLFLKLSTLDKENHRKQRNIYSALLAFVSIYAYMAHSRGIVLVIATIMTVFFISLVLKKHVANYLIYLPVSAVMLGIDKYLTHYFKAATFGPYEPRHGGFDSFDVDTFAHIFTGEGFMIYLKLMVGWIFNLCASTMGLVIIGFLATLFITVKLLFTNKKKDFSMQVNIMSVFTLVVMLGVFFMGTLFFFPSIFNLFTGIKITRGDRAVFGRYTVSAVGPMCFLALYFLIEKKDTIIRMKSKIFSLAFFIGTIGLFWKYVGPVLNGVPRTNARYFLSLTALMKIKGGKTSATFNNLNHDLVLTALVSLCIFVVILFLSYFKNKKVLLSIAAMVFTISFINYCLVFVNVRIAHDRYLYNGVHEVIEQLSAIDRKAHISKDYSDVYVASEGSVRFYQFDVDGNPSKNASKDVKHYQCNLPRFDFSRLQYILDDKKEQFFVVCKKNAMDGAANYLVEKFGDKARFYTLNDFDYENASRDVVFIIRDDLANQVEDAGFGITPFEYKKMDL